MTRSLDAAAGVQVPLADAQRLAVALDNMPGALVYTDQHLNIVFCNDRFREMYIVPPELLQPGRPYAEFLRYLAANGYYGAGDVDLRGFTAFTETAEPEVVMSVLRAYHAEPGREILAHDGTIEHFAGDGVMIVFNDPVPVEDHEMQAIRMALRTRDAVAALASGWRKHGFALGFGVGIAGGYATIGTFGCEGRLEYGSIGTVTNLAARLCGEAEDGQILVSPRIHSKVEAQVEAVAVGELALKGFHRPVFAHNVLAIRDSGAD